MLEIIVVEDEYGIKNGLLMPNRSGYMMLVNTISVQTVPHNMVLTSIMIGYTDSLQEGIRKIKREYVRMERQN